MERQTAWMQGVKLAGPITLGYLAIGLAFGVLARTSGLTVGEVFFMSLLVYAGSAQFIGANLLTSGASLAVVVGTTFLVNLRHLLMSAALSPSVAGLSSRRQALLAFWLTDESFVAAAGALGGRPGSFAFLLGLFGTSHLAWIVATVLGAWLGGWLGFLQAWGLDFALPAMFIALLAMQLKERRDLVIAVVAGALSVAGALYLPANYNVLLAAALAAAVGLLWPEADPGRKADERGTAQGLAQGGEA